MNKGENRLVYSGRLIKRASIAVVISLMAVDIELFSVAKAAITPVITLLMFGMGFTTVVIAFIMVITTDLTTVTTIITAVKAPITAVIGALTQAFFTQNRRLKVKNNSSN